MLFRGPRLVVVVAAVVLSTGLLFFACGGGKETKPEKLLPEGATLIGEIQVEEILDKVDLETLFSALPTNEGDPQTFGEVLDEAMTHTAIDFRKVSRATVFGDVSRLEEFIGVIVRGQFDEDAIVAAIQKAGETSLAATDYKGRRVYAAEEEEVRVALAFIEGENLVFGTAEAVRAVIDVQDGDRDRASGSVQDSFNDLGDGLVRVAVEVPSEALQDQLPLGEIPFLGGGAEGLPAMLGAFQDLKLVGLAVDRDGQTLKFRVILDFESSDSATAFGDFLDGILKLAAGMSPDAQTNELLGQLKVDTDGSKLTIRFEASVSDLSRLLGDLLNVASVESSAFGAVAAPDLPVADRIWVPPTANHVPDGVTVAYSTTPPISGDHWERWAACGFYEGGLPDELTVHNLEHGNVVVSYNLAAGEDVERLRSVMSSLGPAAEWGVTRSYDKIPVGTVALAAWGMLDAEPGVDRGRIARFFDAYAGNLGPERIPC